MNPASSVRGLAFKASYKLLISGELLAKIKSLVKYSVLKKIAAQFQPHCGRSNYPAMTVPAGPVQLLNLESILPLKMVSVYLPGIVLIMTSHIDGHYGKLANV